MFSADETMYEGVGEVSTENRATIRWTIPRCLERPPKVNTALRSPRFVFRDQDGYVTAYTGGWRYNNCEGWLGIAYFINPLPLDSTLRCSILDREGKETLSKDMEYFSHYYKKKWIRTTELQARREELLPGGQLRIVLRVVNPGRREDSDEDTESVGVAETTNFPASSKSDSSRHVDKSLSKLSENLKNLYVQGEDCDLTIRVKDRQFRAHRLLLKSRIPAFCAMLTHDMAENREGVVAMDDCDPDVFSEFLLFVYSGRVKNLTHGNMCGLYVLSDKYGLEDLKETCLEYMKSTLTVDVICDVISIAATHGEAELLKVATEFFVNNVDDILETVKWQVFMQENPTQGNELFRKFVKNLKTKKPTK